MELQVKADGNQKGADIQHLFDLSFDFAIGMLINIQAIHPKIFAAAPL